MDFQSPNNKRVEARGPILGRFRGGKLNPVHGQPVRPNEGGVFSLKISTELDPVEGRLATPPTMHLQSVYVPAEAIFALKWPNDPFAGMTEVMRKQLQNRLNPFSLEVEGEITRRLKIQPVKIAGVKMTNEISRLAHNAAVNFLRKSKYVKAPTVLSSNMNVTPAIIGSSVLDRLNGVLDPDDRVNGAVALNLPNMILPVEGITRWGTATTPNSGANAQFYSGSVHLNTMGAVLGLDVRNDGTSGIFARLNGTTAGDISLLDFYKTQQMDKFVREAAQIHEENPVDGWDAVARWALGLSVETNQPFLIADRVVSVGVDLVGATDTVGIQQDIIRSDLTCDIAFTVPIPRRELGGYIVTFCTLKPDETLAGVPHPILSEPWGIENMIAEHMALEPEAVTARFLDSNVPQASETTIMMYMFRKSTRPAIGLPWLFNYLADLDSKNMVLTSLHISVPDMSGYYHPSGSFLDYVLDAFQAIAWRVFIQTGSYPSQWQALLASLSLEHQEYLYDQTKEKPCDLFDEELPSYRDFIKSDEHLDNAKRAKLAAIKDQCGKHIPCNSCLSTCSDEDLRSVGLRRTPRGGYTDITGKNPNLKRWTRKGCHKLCRYGENRSRYQAFGKIRTRFKKRSEH